MPTAPDGPHLPPPLGGVLELLFAPQPRGDPQLPRLTLASALQVDSVHCLRFNGSTTIRSA
jgi:hypothetical protein